MLLSTQQRKALLAARGRRPGRDDARLPRRFRGEAHQNRPRPDTPSNQQQVRRRCRWTQNWACPAWPQPGKRGYARDDGSAPFRACCLGRALLAPPPPPPPSNASRPLPSLASPPPPPPNATKLTAELSKTVSQLQEREARWNSERATLLQQLHQLRHASPPPPRPPPPPRLAIVVAQHLPPPPPPPPPPPSLTLSSGVPSVRGPGPPRPVEEDSDTPPLFYVYDAPTVLLGGLDVACDSDQLEDHQLLRLLLAHPRRTADPARASLFVIGTPMLQWWACKRPMATVDAALREVAESRWFRRRGGHDHLLLAHSWRFSVWANKKKGSGLGLMKETWARLENVTQTRFEYFAMSRWRSSWDDARARARGVGTSSTSSTPSAPVEEAAFDAVRQKLPWLYADEHELTKRSVVTPWSTPPALAVLTPPPYAALAVAEWRARPVALWYHTRTTPFAHKATALRQLPLKLAAQGGAWQCGAKTSVVCEQPLLTGGGGGGGGGGDGDGDGGETYRRKCVHRTTVCDVGYATNASHWLRGWGRARFCLVLRGDTPSSHALYNAVAAGCVPVVASDGFEHVGLPFAAHRYRLAAGAGGGSSSLRLADFAVTLPEAEFEAAPERLLATLLALPDDVVWRKLRALRAAQPLLVMTHPAAAAACASRVLVQTWRQLRDDPAPQPFSRDPPCRAHEWRRSQSRPGMACLHDITYGCDADASGRMSVWVNKQCSATEFTCGRAAAGALSATSVVACQAGKTCPCGV